MDESTGAHSPGAPASSSGSRKWILLTLVICSLLMAPYVLREVFILVVRQFTIETPQSLIAEIFEEKVEPPPAHKDPDHIMYGVPHYLDDHVSGVQGNGVWYPMGHAWFRCRMSVRPVLQSPQDYAMVPADDARRAAFASLLESASSYPEQADDLKLLADPEGWTCHFESAHTGGPVTVLRHEPSGLCLGVK